MARRGRGGAVAALVAAAQLLLGACAPEAEGTLVVAYQLQRPGGEGFGCADMGAESVELVAYLGAEDALPYDRAVLECSAGASGLGELSVRLTEGSYDRVQIRFLGGVGEVRSICTSGGTEAAEAELTGVDVAAGEPERRDILIVGEPGRCPSP